MGGIDSPKTEQRFDRSRFFLLQQGIRHLGSENFDTYKAIYTTKLKEIDTALYSSAKETDSEWEDLTAYLSDADMQVAPIPKNSKPMLYGNGKVVSLQQPNLEPALFFENKAEKTQYQVPLFLHKPKNVDSFEVIR